MPGALGSWRRVQGLGLLYRVQGLGLGFRVTIGLGSACHLLHCSLQRAQNNGDTLTLWNAYSTLVEPDGDPQ